MATTHYQYNDTEDYTHYQYNGTEDYDSNNDDCNSYCSCRGVAPYGAALGVIFGSFVIITFIIVVCRLCIRYFYKRRLNLIHNIIVDQPQKVSRPRITSLLTNLPAPPPYTPSAAFVLIGFNTSSVRDDIPLEPPPDYTPTV